MYRNLRATTSCLLVVLCALAVRAEPAPALRPAALILDDDSATTIASATRGVTALGGRVLHTLGDVLVIEIPAGSELQAFRTSGVREVALSPVPAGSFGRAAWNAVIRGPRSDEPLEAGIEPLVDDGLTPPAVSLEAMRMSGTRAAVASSPAPHGATALNTSEFLAGAVSVNIVLVESDGAIDAQTENWSASRESEVVARIVSGLEWIRVQEPQSALRFVYHVIPGRTDSRGRTGYEPIQRAADPTGTTGEDRWVKEILGKIGYATGDRFARSRAFDADTRAADGTDWAVTIFVVDSLVDADGKFPDGRFAYTWIGGPHVVMTYDNQAWGISRMDMVLRHEMLHAFYAFDEYAGSTCGCTEHRGYLDGINTNCQRCNAQAAACVMISNGSSLCAATRRQVGWADLDNDGVIDVVGQDPDTFLDPVPEPLCASSKLSGLSTVVAATNRNLHPGTTHPSISINHVAGVELRVDGADWMPAAAAGGTPQSRFSVALPAVTPGVHQVEVRAFDDFGNLDHQPAAAIVQLAAPVDALGHSVRLARNGPEGLYLSWDACAGATRYRVYRRNSPQAAGTLVAEASKTAWNAIVASMGYYQVVPVDACGAERPD